MLAPLLIVDDGDAGYSQAGTWTAVGTLGYGSDLDYAAAGAGSSTATWAFGGLTPGQTYRVLATWPAHPNRATNAPYSLYDGAAVPGNLVTTAVANQRQAPNDLIDSGAGWEELGQLTVSGATASIQLTNNANGYVIADAVALQALPAPPAGPSWIIDDGDAGYSQFGQWTYYPTAGYDGDLLYAPSGNGCCVAIWQFDGLSAGVTYDVYATWLANGNRATDAPYSLYDGTPGPANLVTTVDVNQQLPPDQFFDSSVWWEQIGQLTVSGSTLSVHLSDEADGYVIADAVQVRQQTPLLPQEIAVFDGATNVPDNTGSVAFGNTALGTPLPRTFTVVNQGQQTLTLTPPVSVPAGFTASGFGQTSLAAGQSTTFTVTLTAAAAGNYGGTLSFANNDADENPFNFTISGTVANPALGGAIIIDNGDPDYSAAGNWHDWPYGGYNGDVAWARPNTCCVATWSFTGLTPGNYRVSATWTANTNRATDAPYYIYDGISASANLLAIVDVDQQQPPNDFLDAGVNWEDLGVGVYTVTGSTLTVELADHASSYVIADAIRIEPVTPLLAGGPSERGNVLSAESQLLGEADLQRVLAAAIARWDDAGLSPAQKDMLRTARVTLTDLPNTLLGGSTTAGILIDRDADGQGWFVDATPWEDAEFLAADRPAGMDLLTVLTHELGHMLGYRDGQRDGLAETGTTMAMHSLEAQTRRLPTGRLLTGQNPMNRRDVDGNGAITPLDVLLLINHINAGGAALTPVAADGTTRYFDVTGDSLLSAIDVLDVVNFLNLDRPLSDPADAALIMAAGSASTSGEVDASTVPFSFRQATSSPTDAAPDDRVVPAVAILESSTETMAAAGDDWETMLDLLAEDAIEAMIG